MKPCYLLGLICIFTVVACGHLAVTDSSTSLESRVVELWQAKKGGDWGKAYTFYCENYRDQVSRDNFIRGANLRVLDFQVDAVERQAEDSRALVTVKFDTNIQGFAVSGVLLKEEWVNEGRTWYVCPEPSMAKRLFQNK